jgi:hypothetical protein
VVDDTARVQPGEWRRRSDQNQRDLTGGLDSLARGPQGGTLCEYVGGCRLVPVQVRSMSCRCNKILHSGRDGANGMVEAGGGGGSDTRSAQFGI